LSALGRPGDARLITPDLSSVSAFADLVFQRDDRLFHLDTQTGPDADLPRRILRYNVLLHERFNLPVESFVVLLRRRADRGDLTGRVHYENAEGRPILDFQFEVLRLWERPCAEFLSGGLGIVPLATLGALPVDTAEETALEAVVNRLTQRIMEEAPRPEAARLLTASYILTGLRVPPAIVDHLFQGAEAMRESSTYQAILDEGRKEGRKEGRAEEARTIVLRQGRIRFGEPTPALLSVLTAISDTDHLEALAERILTAVSWQDLLTTPQPSR
jgi:predicted transposase YdaD